jgi:hypothetical protein
LISIAVFFDKPLNSVFSLTLAWPCLVGVKGARLKGKKDYRDDGDSGRGIG